MDFDRLRALPAMTPEEFDRIQERILELASGETKGGHMSKLEELVFQALGEASMCWSEMPKGVFDSDHAKEVGKRLIAAIRTGEEPYFAPLTPKGEEEWLGRSKEQTNLPTANPKRDKRGMIAMPNPTSEQLNDPLFTAIWEVIKTWDINVPDYYVGYCGATGSHVALILNALNARREMGNEHQETHVAQIVVGDSWWDVTLVASIQDQRSVGVIVTEVKKAP